MENFYDRDISKRTSNVYDCSVTVSILITNFQVNEKLLLWWTEFCEEISAVH